MTLFVNVQGRLTAIPGTYQNSIRLADVKQRGLDEVGHIAIVGEGKGVHKPKEIRSFLTAQGAESELVGGDLLDATLFAFNPSDDREVRGATKVSTCKVNPATQSVGNIVSSAPANLLDLKSKLYGTKSVGISYQVANGTNGALGKKITVSQFGKTDEVIDNIGFQCPLAIRYTGDGTASMSVSNTALSVVVAGSTDGTASFTASFSSYETIDELASFVNAQAGFDMKVFASNSSSFLCENLDYVSGVDIKQETGNVTFANDSATTFTGTVTGLDDGDILEVGSELVFIEDASAPTVKRGYGDTLPQAHTTVASSSYIPLSAILQSIIDDLELRSSRIEASRTSGATVGTPANTSAPVFLTGGSNGTSTDADWKEALDALKPFKFNFIVLLSDNPTHHQYLKDHIGFIWTAGGVEAHAFTGHEKDLTRGPLRSRTRAVNDPDILFSFQEFQALDINKKPKWSPPYMDAALNAGLAAGAGVGNPIYMLSKRFTDVRQAASIDVQTPSVQNSLIEDRLLVNIQKNQRYQLVRDITSYSSDDDVRNTSLSARTSIGFTVYKVRETIRQEFQPGGVEEGDASSIKTSTEQVLIEVQERDKAIVRGAELVNGARQVIPAWRNVVVTIEGNVTRVSYTATAKNGRDFILFDSTFTTFQDVA